MKKSLVKNSFFYLIYNAFNMFFPFVTSIYVARILLPSGIGEVAFAQNIVTYFSILAFLGIPTYGVREIAKVRDNKKELNAVYSELLIINGISTVCFSLLYYLTVLAVPAFRENLLLYSVVGITVILNMLNVSWFYEGIEEFGYISLRNAFFKLAMLTLVVLFVRTERDTIPYALVSVFGVAGNNIINIVHSRKYVRFKTSGLNLRRHLKPIFLLVIVNIAIEIYTLVDTTMLGMFSTKEHVAYYYYASKVNKILLQVTNTVTMVLVPRISFCYSENQMDEFNRLLTKSFKIIIIGAVPIIVGMQFVSGFLFSNIFGSAYYVSGMAERVLCMVLIISPVGYLLGSRVLLVSNHESKMFFCVGIGAVVNVIGNFFLIQQFQEMGAAIASVISEFVVMTVYVVNGKKVFVLGEYKSTMLKVCAAAAVEGLSLFIAHLILIESWSLIILDVLIGAGTYLIMLIVLKESTITEYLSAAGEKILHIKTKV